MVSYRRDRWRRERAAAQAGHSSSAPARSACPVPCIWPTATSGPPLMGAALTAPSAASVHFAADRRSSAASSGDGSRSRRRRRAHQRRLSTSSPPGDRVAENSTCPQYDTAASPENPASQRSVPFPPPQPAPLPGRGRGCPRTGCEGLGSRDELAERLVGRFRVGESVATRRGKSLPKLADSAVQVCHVRRGHSVAAKLRADRSPLCG